MPPETWQGAEPCRSVVKWQRRRQRQQRRRPARSLAPRSLLCSDAAEPPEKVCKLPAGAARTPGHLGGGRASVPEARFLPVPSRLLPPLPQGCPLQLVGARAPWEGRSPRWALDFHSRRSGLESDEAICQLACTPPSASFSLPSLPRRRCPK